MCGIGGILTHDELAQSSVLLDRMMKSVEHRGPDDQGMVLFGVDGVDRSGIDSPTSSSKAYFGGLGHRRLSVIDLSAAGHQPMSDPTERYWIAFNGEVYNYLELREELERSGQSFRSNTDTEVVLQSYIAWGARCLERFNGMWAFAIYDRESGSLFCARDRFGVKPFYYASSYGRFAFASEIKQLLVLPWVSAQSNEDMLAEFFLWKLDNHTDQTFFRDVQSLPNGHYLYLGRKELQSGSFEPQPYWRPKPLEALHPSDAISLFRDILTDSVRLRMRSDVPVGVTLSGGIDSSAVVCVAGEHRRLSQTPKPLQAFNVEFGDAGISERAFAEIAADRSGAQLIVLRPSESDLADNWQKFVWHMEQPFGSLSYFSNYQLYRLIRDQGISVVLSGQGADELLLGYPRYRGFVCRSQFRDAGAIAAIKDMLSARTQSAMPLRTQLSSTLYFSFPWLRASRRRQAMSRLLDRDFYHRHSRETGSLLDSMNVADPKSLLLSEISRYQLPHLLHHEDRVSMAHSIETRLPFLDYRLLELVLGQPINLLYYQGWNKVILRRALDGIIPDEIRDRRDKMGYETPTQRLIRANHNMFASLLSRNRDDSLIDISYVEQQFSRNRLDGFTLTSILSYLSWKETFSVA